jgi:NSS family neurotransmitter:Na+ symporter
MRIVIFCLVFVILRHNSREWPRREGLKAAERASKGRIMAGKRDGWKSRAGFIIAASGSAVGLGNIWKFPYVAGQNGGAAFIIIYLAIIFTVGFSVLLAEQSIGRAAQRSPAAAFRVLKGGLWPVVGYIGVLTAFLILPFYSVIGGWTIAYIWKTIAGASMNGAAFGGFIASGGITIAFHALFMAVTVLIVLGGVPGGIERYCRILMPTLLIILIILVIRSVTLPGAEKGIAFFMAPYFSRITLQSVHAALSQAFFSISVGMGVMITYGSYIGKTDKLPGDAAWIVGIDAGVALLAGLAILPAVFAFGMDPAQGPGLIFVTLPAVFAQMPGGYLFGTMFFVMLSVAALTSAMSLLEVVVAHITDEFNIGRKPIVLTIGGIMFLLGIPAALSFGAWQDVKFFGKTIFDLMDFVATGILLPVGAIGISLFVGWAFWPKAGEELGGEHGSAPVWAPLWRWMCGVVAPLLILWILIGGL